MLLQAACAAVYIIMAPGTLMYAVMGPLVVLLLLGAVGLRQLEPWGRIVAIVHSALTLLGVPLGTVLGGFLLVYLFKPEVKAAFADDPDSRRLAAQATDLWRPLSVVIGVGNILLVLSLAGLAAAVVIPRL
jgi:hypothetical protein